MKPFWDLEENINFVKIKSPLDSNYYKVYNSGTSKEQQDVALELSKIRRDINKLLEYIMKNPELWIDKPIAFGIIHTFDIHCPGWKIDENSFKFGNGNQFPISEIAPNEHGIIGLNKPKSIKQIVVDVDGKKINYEIADKRSFHLTVRNKKTGKVLGYPQLLDLAIHELTHTTCNDTRWKEDNHLPPYQSYHTMMRKWAKQCGVL